MTTHISLLLLAISSASSLSSSGCASDLDCSLNGVCGADGACACDAAWAGAACDTLQLLPSTPGDGTCDPSLNGTATGYTTTWGGHPMVDAQGAWHLHVAEMALHCGMCSWGSQSQIAHYRAASVLGPYSRVDLSVGAWSHNPVVIASPQGTPDNVSYLMFHIGIGCDSTGVHACDYDRIPACTNGSTPSHPHNSSAHVPIPPGLARSVTHVAASLDGPWRASPPGWTLRKFATRPVPRRVP